MEKFIIAVLMADGVARRTFIPEDVAEELSTLGIIKWNETGKELSGETLADFLEDADIAITGWGCPKLDAAAVSKASHLKMMIHCAGSVAPYISEALYDAGVTVLSGNKMFAESVAEGTLAYMLAGLRKIPQISTRMQAGIWREESDYSEGLFGQTIGLVGLGAIPGYLVPMLKPFRMRIIGYDPYASKEKGDAMGIELIDDLGSLFEQCKIISLHLPKTKQTHHLISRELLAKIQDGALLINTSRGAVIDEEALADELQSGRISAVLDVYQTEPLDPNSRLRGLPNAILMPHQAGPTNDWRPVITRTLIKDAKGFFAGQKPDHEISRAYGLSMTDDRLKL